MIGCVGYVVFVMLCSPGGEAAHGGRRSARRREDRHGAQQGGSGDAARRAREDSRSTRGHVVEYKAVVGSLDRAIMVC
jgi:hypothetical protein